MGQVFFLSQLLFILEQPIYIEGAFIEENILKMKDYHKKQLDRLQRWLTDLNNYRHTLPRLFEEADLTGDYSPLKKQLQKLAWERWENYDQFYGHRVRALHNQVWENDKVWGKVGEMLDFWKTLKDTDLFMEPNKNKKGIDFKTPSGWEDTKWSLNKWKDFPIELKSTGTASHHWKYVDNGQPVYLRFINSEGCWRIKLDPEMKKQKGRSFRGGASELYDCPKENFEKVWEW